MVRKTTRTTARPTPTLEGQILAVLRTIRGWTQRQLEQAAGLRRDAISDFERGKVQLLRDELQRLVLILGFAPCLIERAASFIRLAGSLNGAGAPLPDGPLHQRIELVAARAGEDETNRIRGLLSLLLQEGEWLEARRAAPGLWKRLRPYNAEERRALVQESEDFQSWALVELLCEESVKAASDEPQRAVELADLAVFISERVPGDNTFRARVQGYGRGFLGNAWRVCGQLRVAEAEFARVRVLWPEDAPLEAGPLDGTRLLDLEASLLRAQRRLNEALDRLDRALAARSGGQGAIRLLVKKGKNLEEMGQYEAGLAALSRAAMLLDDETEPRLRLCVGFNQLTLLCHLDQAEEAHRLLPEVRHLTVHQNQQMDLLRLRWLEGKISAGLGRIKEAKEALNRVRQEFSAIPIAYDAALASLELANVLLTEGERQEVGNLTREMLPVFNSEGVHKEAQAALGLFVRSVQEDCATVALTQSIVRYLYRAQHDPDFRFELPSEIS